MSTDNVQRLQEDLTTMRQAIRTDKPYARADVLPLLTIAIGAIITIPMLQHRLFMNPRLCLLVGLAPGIFLFLRRYFHTRQDKAARPGLWKEYKWSLVAVTIVTPAAVAWMWWSQQFGTNREAAGAAIIFCIGLACCLIGFVDANRRTYASGGIAVMVFAIVLPTLEPRQIPVAGCAFLGFHSFTTAATIWWLTRETAENVETGQVDG